MTGTIDLNAAASTPLCLAFVATAAYRDGKLTRDQFGSFDDLVAWGEHHGLLDADRAEELRQEAAASQMPAARTLALARNLRAALRDLFTPGVPVAYIEVAVETLNAVAPRVLPSVRLYRAGHDVRYAPGETLESWLLAPLLISAIGLVTSQRART
jgi:Putative stress-induced transcription regulator